MVLVDVGATLISCDARLPAALVAEAHAQIRLPQLAAYPRLRRKPPFGEGRLDLLLEGGDGGACLVEVKSCTLVEAGVALFPDAATERGTRHLRSLRDARAFGYAAAMIVVVQRGERDGVSPLDATDLAFGAALRQAIAAGVQVFAFLCDVSQWEVRLARPVSVDL